MSGEGLFGFGQTISHDYDRPSKVRKAWRWREGV